VTTSKEPHSRTRGAARLPDSTDPSSTGVQLPDGLSADIVDTVREPLLVLDANLKVVSANRSFLQTFKVTPEETRGHTSIT
jgi:PAS domain-containing protein